MSPAENGGGAAPPAAREGGKKRKLRLGEYLVHTKILTEAQLEDALAHQKRNGGFLGSILVKLGYVDENQLLKILSIDLDVPAVSFSRIRVTAAAQALVPLDIVKTYKVVPLGKKENRIVLAMLDPTDPELLKELAFRLGKPIRPMVTTGPDIEEAIAFFDRVGYGKEDYLREESLAKAPASQAPAHVYKVLELFVRHPSAELLYLSPGAPPSFKLNGKLERLDLQRLEPPDVERYAYSLMNDMQKARFEEHSDLDFTLTWRDVARFRLAIYRQRGQLSVVVRKLTDKIPEASRLGLPGWINPLLDYRQGLILISAPSGHGRSTTMAALVDRINDTRPCNIVTLEYPVKYLHRHKKANINQREVGTDTESFEEGFSHLFLQAPDVVVLPDLIDRERVAAALLAAGSGRLVLAASAASDGVACLERLVDIFPGQDQNQVRSNLSDCLLAVLSQRLLERSDGRGRVAVFGKVLGSDRIRHAVKMRQMDMLYQQIQARLPDLEYLEMDMARAVREGMVSEEEALLHCPSESRFREFLKMKR